VVSVQFNAVNFQIAVGT